MQELSIPIIHDAFPEVQTPAHCFQIQILHCHSIIFLCQSEAELVMVILPLVSDLFMTSCHFPLLLLIVPAAFSAMRQLSLFPGQPFLCLTIVSRILTLFSCRKDCHPMHCIINTQHLLLPDCSCLVFTGFKRKQKAGIIFTRWIHGNCHRFQSPASRELSVQTDLNCPDLR